MPSKGLDTLEEAGHLRSQSQLSTEGRWQNWARAVSRAGSALCCPAHGSGLGVHFSEPQYRPLCKRRPHGPCKRGKLVLSAGVQCISKQGATPHRQRKLLAMPGALLVVDWVPVWLCPGQHTFSEPQSPLCQGRRRCSVSLAEEGSSELRLTLSWNQTRQHWGCKGPLLTSPCPPLAPQPAAPLWPAHASGPEATGALLLQGRVCLCSCHNLRGALCPSSPFQNCRKGDWSWGSSAHQLAPVNSLLCRLASPGVD